MAERQNVSRARQAAVDECQRLGFSGNVCGRLAQCVTEACANVVMHAYVGRGPPLDMELELSTAAGVELRVLVRDLGRGIVPRADSPGSGLGLLLIRALADHVTIIDGGGHHPTVVALVFAEQTCPTAQNRP